MTAADSATIGSRLETLRVSLGLPLAQIAEMGGWRGPSSVQRYFEPHYNLSMRRDMAAKLATSLGHDVFYIAGFDTVSPPPVASKKHAGNTGKLARIAAQNLKVLRRSRGWSLAILAAQMGTTKATILKLERIEQKIDLNRIEQIATAFEVEPLSLLRPPNIPGDTHLEINGVPQPDRVIVNGAVYVRQGAA